MQCLLQPQQGGKLSPELSRHGDQTGDNSEPLCTDTVAAEVADRLLFLPLNPLLWLESDLS